MKYKLLVSLFIIISIRVMAFAADAPFVSVSGRFSDTALEGKTITIRYYKAYAASALLPPSVVCNVVVKQQGFSVRINDVEPCGYFTVLMPAPYDSDPVIGTVFLVASGDQVKMSDVQSRVRFAGDTGDKFNCQLDINNVTPELIGTTGTISDHYLADNYRSNERSGEMKRNILLKYKDKFTPLFFGILETNIRFETYTATIIGFKDLLNSADSSTRRIARYFFLQMFKDIQTDGIAPDYTKYAIHFNSFLFLKERLAAEMDRSKAAAGFYDFFHRINNDYAGVQRDQLMVTALFAPGYLVSRDSTDHYFQDALSIVQDPIYQNVLKAWMETKGKGAIVFNFSLTDTLNRVVRLSDFMGKVVVIDYYFMGCSGCVYLSKAMGPVYAAFREHPDVVFLSINIDSNFDVFKAAVKSGLYTHPETINVYTNGEGGNHPLIQYYNIQGCPVLMLVDAKGRILDGDPPRPVNYNTVNTKRMISIIQKATDGGDLKEQMYQR